MPGIEIIDCPIMTERLLLQLDDYLLLIYFMELINYRQKNSTANSSIKIPVNGGIVATVKATANCR